MDFEEKIRLRRIQDIYMCFLDVEQNVALLKEECGIHTSVKELTYLINLGLIKPRTLEELLEAAHKGLEKERKKHQKK